jgi:hypothetical protein
MESPQAISPGFDICVRAPKCLCRCQQSSIPTTPQTIYAEKIMITAIFTVWKLIIVEVIPKGTNFNKLYFVDHLFPHLT